MIRQFMDLLDVLADMLLRLRFVVGYSTIIVAGMILAVIVVARLRRMKDRRRRLYRGLLALCCGLVWTGVAGQLGIWQYGEIMQALAVRRELVSVLFSIGVLWVALALGWIAIVVVREEISAVQNLSPGFSMEKK